MSAGVAFPLARALARMPGADSTPPDVTGPVTGGRHDWPFGVHLGDLTAWDYVEEEYFLEGTARSFSLSGGMTPDGKWTATPAGTAPPLQDLAADPPSPRHAPVQRHGDPGIAECELRVRCDVCRCARPV